MALHCSWRSRESGPSRTEGRPPEVAWQPAARLRNRIVHGYWDIDVETLVVAATDDIPMLTIQLEALIASLAQPDQTDDSDVSG